MIDPNIKRPPHSNEAEQSLLGACMLAGPGDVAWLTEDDFYTETHRLTWRGILECDREGEGCDCVTVGEWLRKQGQIDKVGGGAYLTMLANEGPGPANMKGYARIIREHSQRRKLIALGADVSDRAIEGEKPSETIEHIQSQVIDWAGSGTTGPRSIIQAAGSWFERLDQLTDKSRRVDTGLVDVDNILMGMLPSELILLAGRPGMGKTAGMMTAARHIAPNHPVLLFSLEMSAEQLVKRMVSHNIEGHKLRDPSQMEERDWATVRDGVRKLKRYQIHVDDTGGLNVYQLAARAKAWHRNHGIRAIFVDYLQLITAKANSRFDEISEISRQLKKLAKDLDIPVIALAQLNRGVESRQDKRPHLADLRESGQLEQDADVIIFLYRHGYYTEDFESPIAEWIVAKHRDAEPGTAYTIWQPHTQSFLNADESAIDDYKESIKPKDKPREKSKFQRVAGGTA